jgi:hypothetical protein
MVLTLLSNSVGRWEDLDMGVATVEFSKIGYNSAFD